MRVAVMTLGFRLRFVQRVKLAFIPVTDKLAVMVLGDEVLERLRLPNAPTLFELAKL